MADQPQFAFPFDFAKLMSEFDPTKVMGEMSKAFAAYKVPGVDVDLLVQSQRRNVEALTTANKAVLEGVQAVLNRQSEILQQTLEAATTGAKELASASSLQDATVKEAELVKQSFEKALANMRELAELMAKSNTEAFEAINRRIAESLEEIKQLTQKVQ